VVPPAAPATHCRSSAATSSKTLDQSPARGCRNSRALPYHGVSKRSSIHRHYALELADRLKVHAARHHWAVLALRAGVPVRVVQCQLGHATPTLTLGLYGAFLPSGEDRATWRAGDEPRGPAARSALNWIGVVHWMVQGTEEEMLSV